MAWHKHFAPIAIYSQAHYTYIAVVKEVLCVTEKEPGVKSVQESVFRSLRKNILNLTLLPGTQMSANEVSDMMQVSRTPVREAFIRLEREGLIHVIPQRETIVSRIDLRRSWQEQFLRESLELAVLAPFIKMQSTADIEKMRGYIQLQR